MSHFFLKESVDLTEEDDDSRDTVNELEINLPHLNNTLTLQNVRVSNLPPLTPIPRVNKSTKIDNSCPTLRKIEAKNEAPKIVGNITPGQFFGDKAAMSQFNNTSKGKIVLIKKNNKLYKIVIPHNVMPTSDAGGPVTINIPEVGPLVIKIDPQVKKQMSPTPTTSKLEPFSLNVDKIVENTLIGETMEKQLVNKKMRSSTQKVFRSAQKLIYCWKSTPKTKKNLSFHGFSKREGMQTKRCFNQLMRNKNLLEEIVKSYTEPKNITSQNKSTKKGTLKSKEESCTNTLGIGNDKKKNLNKKNRISKIILQSQNLSENDFKHLIKPCFVSVVRQKTIENLIKCDKPQKNKSIIQKSKINPYLFFSNVADIEKEQLDLRKTFYLSNLIKDKRKFHAEMSFIKPVLIINKFNFSIVQFAAEFSKSNIIFPVDKDRHLPQEILKCIKFRDAVKAHYIKLIDSDLLFSYLRGELGPR